MRRSTVIFGAERRNDRAGDGFEMARIVAPGVALGSSGAVAAEFAPVLADIALKIETRGRRGGR